LRTAQYCTCCARCVCGRVVRPGCPPAVRGCAVAAPWLAIGAARGDQIQAGGGRRPAAGGGRRREAAGGGRVLSQSKQTARLLQRRADVAFATKVQILALVVARKQLPLEKFCYGWLRRRPMKCCRPQVTPPANSWSFILATTRGVFKGPWAP